MFKAGHFNIVNAMELSLTFKVLLIVFSMCILGYILYPDQPYMEAVWFIGEHGALLTSCYLMFMYISNACFIGHLLKRDLKKGEQFEAALASYALVCKDNPSKHNIRVFRVITQIACGGSRNTLTNINWFTMGLLILPFALTSDVIGMVLVSATLAYVASLSAWMYRHFPEEVDHQRKVLNDAISKQESQ